MSDTAAPAGTDPSTRRWNTAASVAAGLLAGAFLLVGITMPSGTTSPGTGANEARTTATSSSLVTAPAAPHVATADATTATSSAASPTIVTLSADIDD